MSDARFQDGAERPLRLIARDQDDLRVLSSLTQDAVLTGADLRHRAGERRFTMLLNRFRWEDQPLADTARRPVERVRAVLDFGDVLKVRHQGLEGRDAQTVLSLLAVTYQPEAEAETAPDQPAGPGRVTLVFSGDGAIALDVECLEVHLADVTRPYAAPARRAPRHPLDE